MKDQREGRGGVRDAEKGKTTFICVFSVSLRRCVLCVCFVHRFNRRVRKYIHHNRPAHLAPGDSYTIGQSIDEPDRWPVQLVRRLREQYIEIADPQIIATTGWTTGDRSYRELHIKFCDPNDFSVRGRCAPGFRNRQR
jgi:hypothetical protein